MKDSEIHSVRGSYDVLARSEDRLRNLKMSTCITCGGLGDAFRDLRLHTQSPEIGKLRRREAIDPQFLLTDLETGDFGFQEPCGLVRQLVLHERISYIYRRPIPTLSKLCVDLVICGAGTCSSVTFLW